MIPSGFAQEWEAAWNSHDLSWILDHYAPEIRFHSAKAVSVAGQGTLIGHEALESYWSKALIAQPNLHFEVQEVFVGHDMLAITYTNHTGRRAVETLRFNATGLVVEASACHGPQPQGTT